MILSRVRRTIAERGLLARGDHVVVACSGGPDSVALADVLARLGSELGVTLLLAAVDHGLRAEAKDEVRAVGELADRLELPFRALRVDVADGPSLQGAARRARYAALLDLARAERASRIATGHTRDDQAETVLQRILRGAGIDGLSGIAPRRRDGVVRPLIDVRRAELLAHLSRAGLGFAVDPSNDDRRQLRPRVRHDLLPLLRAEDPAVVEHLASLADDARAAARLVRAEGRRLLRLAGRPDGELATDALRDAEPAARRAAIRLWLREVTGRRPGRAHIDAVDLAVSGRGEVLLGDGWAARAEGTALRLTRGPRSTRSSRDPAIWTKDATSRDD